MSGRRVRSVSAIVAGASLCLLLPACDRGAAGDPSVVRTDSLGIRIITSGADDRPLPWRFEQVGVMLDSAGEPWLFEVLPHEFVLTDRGARTYVLTSERTIVRFSPNGRHDRTMGGRGSGPGEMQLPTLLGQQGDSIFVIDPVRGALIRWGSDLTPISQLPLEGAFAQMEKVAFRTGGLWVEQREFSPSGVTTIALLGDTTGSTVLHRVEQPVAQRVPMCGGSSISLPPLFSPTLRWVVNGPRILVSAAPAYELWLYEGNRLIASIRRSLPDRAPTIADAEREMPEGLRVIFGGSVGACTLEAAKVVEATGMAPVMPHVDDLRLLSDGTMWVQRPSSSEAGLVVDVFGSDGAYLGTSYDTRLPVGRLPNGELLIPVEDSLSGGFHLARMKVMSAPR